MLGLRRREPSVSFLEAFQMGVAGQSDLAVLQIAADQARVLVSHDVRTMPRYFHEFIRTRTSPGIILVPQSLALSAAIEDLALLWTACEEDEWVNRICYLPL